MPRSDDDLSILDQHVMYALIRLHPNAYGVNVRDEIEKHAGKVLSIGSVYATLDRLEARGFAATRTGEATAERGGRRKTYYSLTGLGQRALRGAEMSLDAMRIPIIQGSFA
jgi:PadR family transcriptional regulator PadR